MLIYEGLGIGFISFWIVNLGLCINIFNFIESYNLGIVCILIILILTLLSFYNGSKINIKKLNVYSSKLKKKKCKFVIKNDFNKVSLKKSISEIKKKLDESNSKLLQLGIIEIRQLFSSNSKIIF